MKFGGGGGNFSRTYAPNWNKLQSDKKCQKIFKQVPVVAYKRSKNLKEYFAERLRYMRDFEKGPIGLFLDL